MVEMTLYETIVQASKTPYEERLALPVFHAKPDIIGADTMAKHRKQSSSNQSQGSKEETPAEAFYRLAQGRTNKACKSIALIGQLTGPAYESTDVQKAAIIGALQASLDVLKDIFDGKSKASDSFKLPL